MNIVVTGCCGFIGNAVIREINQRKLKCIPVSRTVKKHCQNHHIVKKYKEAPQGDILIHLAENSNVSEVNLQNNDYIKETIELFNEMINKKYNRIIYASSYLVYGDKLKKKWNESEPVSSFNAYTEIKLKCERILQTKSNNYACARLTNVYGPGMSDKNIFSDIIKQIGGSKSVFLNNDKPVRDYIYIDDVARGLVDIAIGTASGIFNLGTGKGISVKELGDNILSATQQSKKQKIKSISRSKSESHIQVDISKIKRNFGWEPNINLVNGINQLIKGNNE